MIKVVYQIHLHTCIVIVILFGDLLSKGKVTQKQMRNQPFL